MHGQRQRLGIFSSGKTIEEISKDQKRDAKYSVNVKE
jgi:hypothetical protein